MTQTDFIHQYDIQGAMVYVVSHNQYNLEEIDETILLLISCTTNVNMIRFDHDTVGAAVNTANLQ